MSNQKYFDVPWAFAGDQTVIPDPLQTGGTVSFTEGWNYNYQRDLATDPAAIPIDRATTNYLFNVITAAIAALQSETVPEFILASQNGGTAIAYGPQAVVLYSSSGSAPFAKYVNITGTTNSNTPSASDPLGSTTGWQVVCDPIATSAQAAAGTNNASIMTPLLVAQQTALRALLAGNGSQVFNVGPATALTHAPEAAQVQQNSFNYAGAAGGTANALTATLAPAPTALTDDLIVVLRVGSANTGATTLNVNSLGVITVVGQAHAALQGGELIANGFACFAYSTALTKFVLLWATGGAEQIGNAAQSQHAVTFGQVAGVVGQCRNLKCSTTALGTTLSYSADEIIVESGLGGLRYCLANFSQTLNGATTGLGGLDTGSLAASSYYAIYAAITSSGTQGIFAQLEPSGGATSIYGGSHLPSNVIATALIGVWPTSSTSQFVIGNQSDRSLGIPNVAALATPTIESSWTALSIAAIVPKSAKRIRGSILCSSSAASNTDLSIAESSAGVGLQQTSSSGGSSSAGSGCSFGNFNLSVAQTMYWQSSTTAGTPSFVIEISGYDF